MNTRSARSAPSSVTEACGIPRIAAQQVVSTEGPEVTQPADRRVRGGHSLVIGACCPVLLDIGENGVDLANLEAGQLDSQSEIRQQD